MYNLRRSSPDNERTALETCRGSPSLAVAQDGHLQRVTIPETAYVQFASLTS